MLLLARRIVQDEYLEKFANRQPEDYGDVVEDYINDFIVVRLVGLMDPLKPDIRQTVRYVSFVGRFYSLTHFSTFQCLSGCWYSILYRLWSVQPL